MSCTRQSFNIMLCGIGILWLLWLIIDIKIYTRMMKRLAAKEEGFLDRFKIEQVIHWAFWGCPFLPGFCIFANCSPITKSTLSLSPDFGRAFHRDRSARRQAREDPAVLRLLQGPPHGLLLPQDRRRPLLPRIPRPQRPLHHGKSE